MNRCCAVAMVKRLKRAKSRTLSLSTAGRAVGAGEGGIRIARRRVGQEPSAAARGSEGADRKAGTETLFFEPEGEGFSLPPDSPALHVIQHIRDESHDHAISGHRKNGRK